MHKWRDAQGNVHYSDEPPPSTAQKTEKIRGSVTTVPATKIPKPEKKAQKLNPDLIYSPNDPRL